MIKKKKQKKNPHTTPTLLTLLTNAIVYGTPADLLHAIDFYEIGHEKCEECGFKKAMGCECLEPCDNCEADPCMCDWKDYQVKAEAMKFANKVLDDKQLKDLNRMIRKAEEESNDSDKKRQQLIQQRQRVPHYSSYISKSKMF